MMESMLAVMQRINEIRQRFHVSRPVQQEQRPAGNFGIELSQRLEEQGGARVPINGDFAGDGGPDATATGAIRDMARDYASRNRVSPALVNAVIETESSYNPRAVSPRGAMGLMQLMPDVARGLGVENPFEPEENIRGGVTLLRRLLDKYRGDQRLALAAYNAGEGAVDRSGGVPDFPETRDYVERVISAYRRNSQ